MECRNEDEQLEKIQEKGVFLAQTHSIWQRAKADKRRGLRRLGRYDGLVRLVRPSRPTRRFAVSRIPDIFLIHPPAPYPFVFLRSRIVDSTGNIPSLCAADCRQLSPARARC